MDWLIDNIILTNVNRTNASENLSKPQSMNH